MSREDISRAMQLRLAVPLTKSSSSCVCCHKDTIFISCKCKVCVYCSRECMTKDISHHTRCDKIKQLTEDIQSRTTNLRTYHNNVVHLFSVTYASRFVDGKRVDLSEQFCRERKELLDKRELLIKELLYEGGRMGGYAGEYTNQNVLACDIAALQSLDLELLCSCRKPRWWEDDDIEFKNAPNLVMNVHLLTGRFEELYQKCQTYLESSYTYKNIAEPFNTEGLSLFNGETQFIALIHIFLLKYTLHMSMKNLHQINTHFLNNKDCINLIGEYVGLKKEWIITDYINWYRDQAYEVARLIHCMDEYHPSTYDEDQKYNHILMTECFEKVSKMAKECFPGRSSVIEAATRIGKEQINKIKSDRMHSKSTNWAEIIKSYEVDWNIIKKYEIGPSILTGASKRINIFAGWNAIGTNVHPELCTAEFVAEAMKACPEHSFVDIFYGCMHTEEDSLIDEDEESDAYYLGDLDAAVKTCVAIEQKLAQCYFHKRKGEIGIGEILDQLPGGSEAYASKPPPDDSEYAIHELVDDENDIRVVAKWPSDVVQLVAALFNKGLATEDNLDLLFGRSGYVSCVVWALQEEKQKRNQPSIASFVTRTRLWKEGCTDYDKLSGLKIKYLNRQDRSQRFVELMQQLRLFMSVGSLLQSVPSVEQFVSKFGWKCLSDTATKQFLVEWISLTTDNDMEDNSNPKRRRCDLDSFLTAEDACRHYFDTRSLEEAVWDAAGVPRIIILNGNMEIMQKAGWKYYKGGIRGDKSVKLGSRIAHVLPISSRVPYIICWEEEQVGKSPQKDHR